MPVLCDRPDVTVLTTEAHRSQYDTLAWNMRAALGAPEQPVWQARDGTVACLVSVSLYRKAGPSWVAWPAPAP